MKKQKLSIKKLEISSFVTETQKTDLKGGGAKTAEYTCDYNECGTGYETIYTCERTNYQQCGTGPV